MIESLEEIRPEMIEIIDTFENSHPFIPGTTNVTSYVSFLLDTIYRQLFKPDNYKHGKQKTKLDLSNVQLLRDLWEILRGICLKYGSACTVNRFCVFTGISVDTFNTWKNGEYRTKEHSELVKDFLRDSESDLLARAVDSNSIGAIFALKAGFGYSDQQPQTLTIKRGDEMPQLTQEEIRERLEMLEDINGKDNL